MKNYTEAEIISSLDRCKKGVAKYIEIMDLSHKVDVSTNPEFQRMFNGFYRMRQKTKEYYSFFFSYMERMKANKNLEYKDVIEAIFDKFNRKEKSFSSKLLHTINPEMAILDSIIISNLEIIISPNASVNSIISSYDNLNAELKAICDSIQGKKMINLFDSTFPNNSISDIKKIDFVLWQIRDNKNTHNKTNISGTLKTTKSTADVIL